MNRFNACKFAVRSGLALLAIGATVAQAGGRAQDAPTVQAAQLFLLDLERRSLPLAYRRMHPLAQRDHRPDELNPRVRLGVSGGFQRRLLSDRSTRHATVVDFDARALPAGSEYRIVCFLDVPASGFGRVQYISVLLGQGRSEPDWSVLSYRIRSSRDGEC